MKENIPTPERNAFRVPEGYFQTLPDRVMQNIARNASSPHGTPIRRRRSRLFIRLAAAAVLTGFFSLAGLNILLQTRHAQHTGDDATATVFYDGETSDELLDYVMLGNAEIEYYLTVAE